MAWIKYDCADSEANEQVGLQVENCTDCEWYINLPQRNAFSIRGCNKGVQFKINLEKH